MQNSEIVNVLKGLVEICKDGQQGYKDAADDIKDEELAKIMLNYSNQREKFAFEIRDIIVSFGSQADMLGNTFGVVHRLWMDIRFGIAGNGTEAIFRECLRGEKAALRRYRDVLKSDLPEDIHKKVTRQYEEINEAHENIKRFLDLAENKVFDS
jgi:uncharacterized protein (TIGR02284 family)